MEDLQGKILMRFIGKPNGVFMKGAPGNYRQGECYTVPILYRHYAYWEPVDPIPVLKVPPPTEEELKIEAFTPPPDSVVLSTPDDSEEEAEFVRRETESLGDGVLDEKGLMPKRRRSKVDKP